MMILNLGCGNRRMIGAVNADIEKQTNPDVVMNMDEKFPFKDNEFDKVVMHHSIEHSKDIGFTLGEAIRVSKCVEMTVPTQRSPGYSIPEHNYFFNVYGLRGKTQGFPVWFQRLLGLFIPSEWVIEVRRK